MAKFWLFVVVSCKCVERSCLGEWQDLKEKDARSNLTGVVHFISDSHWGFDNLRIWIIGIT